MKTIIKKHPIKDIILDFDETKDALDIETEALALYDEGHDLLWTLKQECEEQAANLKLADEKINELHSGGLVLQQQLDIIEDGLGLHAEEDMTPLEGEMTINISDFMDEVHKHNKEMQDFYSLIEKIVDMHNHFVDLMKQDEEDEYFPINVKYFELFDEVFRRYEDVSVDIVTLDEDYEKFKEVYNVVDDLFREDLDMSDELLQRYHDLFDFTDDLYKRTDIAYDLLMQKFRESGLDV